MRLFAFVHKETGELYKSHSNFTGVWFSRDLIEKKSRTRNYHWMLRNYRIAEFKLEEVMYEV